MISQPTALAIATTLSGHMCKMADLYYNRMIEQDYFIRLCKTSILDNKSFKEKTREEALLINLLQNTRWLNYTNEYGKQVTHCDLNKIYNL